MKHKIHFYIQVILMSLWVIMLINFLLFMFGGLVVGGLQLIHFIVLVAMYNKVPVLRKKLMNYAIGVGVVLLALLLYSLFEALIVVGLLISLALSIYFLVVTYDIKQHFEREMDKIPDDFLQENEP